MKTASESSEPPTPVKRSRMTRDLRRRLWKALQEEDVDTAIRAYTATKQDYHDWIEEEARKEQERLQLKEAIRKKEKKLRQQSRPVAIQKLGSMVKSTRNSIRHLGADDAPTPKQSKRKSLKLRRGSSLDLQARKSNSDLSYSVQDYDESSGEDESDPGNKSSVLGVLQSKLSPSDPFEPDDFYGPHDSYAPELLLPKPPPINANTESRPKRWRSNRTKSFRRLAGFDDVFRLKAMSRRRSADNYVDPDSIHNDNESQDGALDKDSTSTTLLHEAARLGSPELIRLLLEQEGDPDNRSGQLRTALHMVCGGMTSKEEAYLLKQQERRSHVKEESVGGIQSPIQEFLENQVDASAGRPEEASGKKAVFKFWKHLGMTIDNNQDVSSTASMVDKKTLRVTDKEWQTACAQRLEALLVTLEWNSNSGEGPSINSVDDRGRTALHYAAELGRTDVCKAVLSKFGAILTIIDESGRTPCELAGAHGHGDLAAELEARALLYMDPYGMDDEMMASIGGFGQSPKLVPPFCWFETWTADKVEEQRESRVQECLKQMKATLESQQAEKELQDFILNYGTTGDVDESMDSHQLDVAAARAAARVASFCDSRKTVTSGVETNKENVDSPLDTAAANAANQVATFGDSMKVKSKSEVDSDEATNPEEAKPPGVVQIDAEPSIAAKATGEYQYIIDALQEAHADRYLAFHGWNVENAIDVFDKSPLDALANAGIRIPKDHHEVDSTAKLDKTMCLICCDEFFTDSKEWIVLEGCGDGFCSACLGDYIAECARTRETGLSITCPQHNCPVPLSQDEVQSLSPTIDVLQSLVNASNENSVAAAQELSFCPHPGCQGLVHRDVPNVITSNDLDHDLINLTGAVCTAVGGDGADSPLTYEGVHSKSYNMTRNATQPTRAHRFCFACSDSKIHFPVPCDQLERWKEKIAEEIGKVEDSHDGEAGPGFDDVAQKLWMKANTRPCPKCKIPIEKNDGCNHMTCSNRHCRHEFCWICREDWKLHNTDTGGFFRCNRWQGDQKHESYDGQEHVVDENEVVDLENPNDQNRYGTALHSSKVAYMKNKEMGRFLHHYRRWTAHSESATLERRMPEMVCTRMGSVVEAAIEFSGSPDFDFGGKGLSFVHTAFTELLECRSLLQHSYAFAFFRYPTVEYSRRRTRQARIREKEKEAFEELQSELEMMTEQMSDIIARQHLRASQVQIMFLTSTTCEKRSDFTAFMLQLLQQQRKDDKAEAERASTEEQENEAKKKRRSRLPDPFDFPQHYNRDQMPTAFRRLMDEYYDNRYTGDSDDEVIDHSIVKSTKSSDGRLALEEEESLQRALQESIVSYEQESVPAAGDRNDDQDDSNEGRFGGWACSVCTYMNSSGQRCAMCDFART